MKTKTKKTVQAKIALPIDILESDLNEPKLKRVKGKWDYSPKMATSTGDAYGRPLQFKLWYVERFGWCLPTLDIRKARWGSGTTDRTYAVTLDGSLCRIGFGPHVLRTVTVYVKASRLKKLQRFIDLRQTGEAGAHSVRDRISSRRAETSLRRASWRY